MKEKRRLIAIALAFSMLSYFTGCTSAGKEIPSGTNGLGTDGFQKEMNMISPLRLRSACKTEGGYYLQWEGFLYFMDSATGDMIVVCSKPECSHDDPLECNAWINSPFLSCYQGKLYYANGDGVNDSILTLCSMNPDGTEHTVVQKIQTVKPLISLVYHPMLVNGCIYFIESNTMLYRAKLGQDVSTASLLFEENTSGKLENETRWKFWADRENIYAMNHFLNSSGEYQDVLYLLGESRSDTREIWNSSQLQTLAEDGSYWYIAEGMLYYYVSGADLWEVDLNTGDDQKIIPLASSVKSGEALFTDTNAIILDLDGSMIAIYDYSGDLKHEISLLPVYESHPDTDSCDLVFADGDCVFVLAYRGKYNSPATNLYQVNWTDESLREIDTWPGAGVTYQNGASEEVYYGTID